MYKEILSIITPKGELTGIPFFVNNLILRIIATIFNYIGLYFSINNLLTIPAIMFLSILIVIATLCLVIIIIFNYKRRLLNITGNLAVSIILAIALTIGINLITTLVYPSLFLTFVEILIIPIILSIIPSRDCNKKEYWQTFFVRLKNFFKHPITIFVIAMLIADLSLIKISELRNLQISKIMPNNKMEELAINPLSSYTGKTKDEILKDRKQIVKQSLFNSDNYLPRDAVFGQIEDKKAWWGIDYIICSDKSINANQNSKGNSEESRYINNPNMLVGVQMSKSFIKTDELKDFCNDKSLIFIPNKISYDKKTNLIIINYKVTKNAIRKINNKYIEYLIEGINARDFGYNWVYANNYKNVFFMPQNLDSTTLNQKPQVFKDFIHLGTACKVDGGCNNASPYQQEMAFYLKELPADMTLSLWKNKPFTKHQPANIYLKMIFEE